MLERPSTVDEPGSSVLGPADRLDGLDAVAAEVFGARTEREGEHVEDEVGGVDAVALDREVVDAPADAELVVGDAGLALFVDGEDDHRGAVLPRQRHDAVEPLALGLALLEVGRVEDGLAAEVLETGLEHGGLGGVEHQRERGLGREAARDLVHVDGAVAPDVVDAHVEHVRAFLHLLARHLHAGVPVGLEHRLAELLRAVGVGALADGEVRELLVERDRAVDGRAARLEVGSARDGGTNAELFGDGAQVRGRGAAAASHDVEAELVDEAHVRLGQTVGGEVVVGVAVDDRRQPGVGQARQVGARVLREIAQVLGHLRGPGGAVETDHVGAQGLERGEGGADLGADEEAPGRLDGDLHHDRQLDAHGGHRPAGADDGGLALEQVLHRLHQQHVGAAGEEPRDHRLVVVAQFGERDLAQRRQAGAGPDRADHEARSIGGREPRRDLLGQAGGLLVDGERLVGDPVLVEHQGERAERRRLHRVDAGLEVLRVHPLDQVGAGEDEPLVAPFECRAPEVVGSEPLVLHPGAERAVEHEHTLVEGLQELRHGCLRVPEHPFPPGLLWPPRLPVMAAGGLWRR